MDSSREGEDLLLGRVQLLTSVVQLGLECSEALMERVDRRVLLVGQLAHSLLYGAQLALPQCPKCLGPLPDERNVPRLLSAPRPSAVATTWAPA